MHFSVFLIIFKLKKLTFPQKSYDSLFFSIENDLRELGFGDVAVNKKMKDFNKIFYDILLKLNNSDDKFNINENLVFKYFSKLKDENDSKYQLFEDYFTKFFNFCFVLDPEIVIKEAINFKV